MESYIYFEAWQRHSHVQGGALRVHRRNYTQDLTVLRTKVYVS
jgi:hypothetical protein